MATIDISPQRAALLDDAIVLEQLPQEILAVIREHTSTNLLDVLSQAALIPQLTSRLFVHFEHVFPDLCARWILNPTDAKTQTDVLAAFARVLRFAPYLSTFLRHYMSSGSSPTSNKPLGLQQLDFASLQNLQQDELLRLLLAVWRLISFDAGAYSILVSPAQMQSLFAHEHLAVRYLCIRIFCLQVHAADAKREALIREHVGASAISGDFDGQHVDFGFLPLHEHARVENLDALRRERNERALKDDAPSIPPQPLTPLVACYGQTILPRPSAPSHNTSSLVPTTTTSNNLESLAGLLKDRKPILLHGLPGSGKTSVIHEFAKEFGKHSGMVTLHINEQTDAKMLVGLYAADSKPGSFSWRPGVLTTAVREGRWVLIEDLDRAPNEVISTLLPLIERGQLLIPSRGETIEASSEFRLFATVRTTKGMHGRETLPNLLGLRFWQQLSIQIPSEAEFLDIIVGTYPVLRRFASEIMAVFRRLTNSVSGASRSSFNRSLLDRQPSSRDLLRWCRRLASLLGDANCTTGDEPISDTTRDQMFMEAVDCFVSRIPDAKARQHITFQIAEEWHMSKERVEHYLEASIPQLEDGPDQFRIGRVKLRKKKDRSGKIVKSKRPFANTTHAKKLLEQAAVAVKSGEPVLLVGETGIGKTTVIQQLADTLGHKLIAVNLSQQSEVGDLLGGFKPVNVRSLAVPLMEEFEDLFAATGISATKNQAYLELLGKTFAKGDWSRVSRQWRQAPKMFIKIVEELTRRENEQREARNGEDQPTKRRKTESKLQRLLDLKPRWDAFTRSLDQFEIQMSGGSGAFAFSFVEGNIVKAARNGDWVLLDEINLASPDTLESIADLLTGPAETPSILLSETGEIQRIKAHPNFRMFGAMNPATDIGKRDLPIGIRSRFTEIYVDSPDRDVKDLLTIVKTYLKGSGTRDDKAADDIARLYLDTKLRAEEKSLVDGANEVPHFSLRTLTRVLSYVNHIAPFYGLRRALYEGFSMGFLTLLNRDSEKLLMPLIDHRLFGQISNPQSLLSKPPTHPDDGKKYVRFVNKAKNRHYWLSQGALEPQERSDYIITPYVERNLLNLVRATSTRKFPILIQGPTSAGKTSMIEYLANFTGNKFVRINNHEHTDLQEYLGTYASDSNGKLRFQEGLLVQAMRQGHWIVLDELNLAPTDVLEALNRLLDDNRELLIPETQEIVRPHENFMLFSTQNPPGLYGGRKALSRAFRNRFLELHYDDIPEDELEYILQQRSRNTAPSDCKRIVTVYKELSRLRQTSRMFEQKDSFATLRDLFRWTQRSAEDREQIAINGFMLLAERVRVDEERIAVKEIIEKVFKVKIDPEQLYSTMFTGKGKSGENSQGVVWTGAMRRLYTLVDYALRNNEPVLLVGDTGCGKTTVCQMLAEALGKELHIVNAHQNTETGDLIGSQRPVRNRGAISDTLKSELATLLSRVGQPSSGSFDELMQAYRELPADVLSTVDAAVLESITALETKSKALFEWSDGSLVNSMKSGDFFLLDEISLADDSVLERLNSVLEPGRTLLLAEKGIDNSFVTASNGFQFLATMNPGGDFGKKELSPALRNRFTEIWVPSLSDREDVLQIVRSKLDTTLRNFGSTIVHFSAWFGETFRSSHSAAYSIRDILLWVKFINHFGSVNPDFAVVHGAATVFVDTLGANPSALLAMDPKSMEAQRQQCLNKLSELLKCDATKIYRSQPEVTMDANTLSLGQFEIAREPGVAIDPTIAFNAPTTRLNLMRVLRSLQMQKPILLEGSPGVGKTTLVAALASTCGRPLTRINLSDQTDLMDLFGTDMPVEGAEAGNFAWRDAPFLQAMQRGEWVLLDEMNLASQSVLEGLNACLDHRGEVYISELDQVFHKHPNFRLFAAQNPHHQGGGRKGLPSSFVNRFIVVYADVLTEEDLLLIARHSFPDIPSDVTRGVIRFITKLDHQIVIEKSFGLQGGPWEFNLRDILRWLNLLASKDPLLSTGTVDDFLGLIVRQRFRSNLDRKEVDNLFASIFGRQPHDHSLYHDISTAFSQVGNALIARNQLSQPSKLPAINVVPRLSEIESVMICVKQNTPCIVGGPSGSGKSALLQHVAAVAGKSLVVFPLNADIDTMDLVGGFEQADPLRELNAALRALHETLEVSVLSQVPAQVPLEALSLLHALEGYQGNLDALEAIAASVQTVLSEVSPTTEIAALLTNVFELLQKPLEATDPRFEWLDGVIVKALQTGQWLVLDNANLCNASVLDRLNSLLEPNGFLSINEHCGPDGEPRLIKPHPEFRIFLTVDSRYGELSRAMRNRAIEIHLSELPDGMKISHQTGVDVDSNLRRLQMSRDISAATLQSENFVDIGSLTLDNLSVQDTSLVPRYSGALTQTLMGLPSEALEKYRSNLEEISNYLTTDEAAALRQATLELYATLPNDSHSELQHAQPLSTLQNAPIARLLQRTSGDLAFWLNCCFQFILELQRCQSILKAQVGRAKAGKLASLNRLQRSVVSDRIAAVAKDSTASVSKFLNKVLQAALKFLQDSVKDAGDWKDQSRIIRHMMDFWWRTFGLVTQQHFEEARFQAHLGHGVKSLQAALSQVQESSIHGALASGFLQAIQEDFNAGFKLKTGLSMEPLWNLLKPAAILSAEALESHRDIERLAIRFDALRWKVRTSISDLASAMSTLVTADQIVRSNASLTSQLIVDLKKEIDTLEAGVSSASREVSPFFTAEYETLRQALVLQSISYGTTLPAEHMVLAVASDLPTFDQSRFSNALGSAQKLLSTGLLASRDAKTHVWNGKLATSLLAKSNSIKNASLDSLRLLEAELPLLGRTLARSAPDITSNSIQALNNSLKHLISEIIAAHGLDAGALVDNVFTRAYSNADLTATTPEQLKAMVLKIRVAFPEEWPAQLVTVFKDHLLPSIVALAASDKHAAHMDSANTAGDRLVVAFSSVAWVQFSVGCIKLYVPDKAFDPQLRPQYEMEVHGHTKAALDNRLASLVEFETHFTGQKTSLRAQLVQEEIEALGAAPPASQILYRPAKSELGGIQADFNNILKSVVDMDVASTHVTHTLTNTTGLNEEMDLVRLNVGQLIDRLSSRFDAYQDMVLPAVNILHCLQLGLSLNRGLDSLQDQLPTAPFMGMLPFLGGTLPTSNATSLPTRSLNFLNYMGLVVSVEGLPRLDAPGRQALFSSIHGFFDDWNKKLEADRKTEQENTSLYKFRGSFEDEEEQDEEEFNELFPTFDDEEDKKPAVQRQKVRDLSVKMAELHRNIFSQPEEASESLRKACAAISHELALEASQRAAVGQDLNRKMLPSAMWSLYEELSALNVSVQTDNYNFYSDANLPMVRQLISLVNKVELRFHELQQVDEIGFMQPLADVLTACETLLSLVHTEPLASILPKLEHLHMIVYEWQHGGYAPAIYGAPALYTALTDMIISWRREELKTWARLFDLEAQKCRDDANSWFFMAYQVVIAVPLTLVDKADELQEYAVSLVKELGNYFSTSIVGQFSGRLALLRQMQKHLELLTVDYPSLAVVRDATQNFITFYSRFEAVIDEAIGRGRTPIEKNVKNTVLMASWKDTNINALRESARKSHRSLFRLVRKFRSVLGQPAAPVIEQGLPDKEPVTDSGAASIIITPSVDKKALTRCKKVAPQWLKQNKRLINIDTTLSVMANVTKYSSGTTAASQEAVAFVESLKASIAELRKETPQFLNDENKDQVKHLKTRKRNLFADVLKAMRKMGVRHNLGTEDLNRQKTTATVLGSTRAYVCESEGQDAAEYYFQKAIDIAAKVRPAGLDHHSELTGAEVTRSVGFMEGFVQLLLQQRASLVPASTSVGPLSEAIGSVRQLSTYWGDKSLTVQRQSSNLLKAVDWIVPVLRFGVQLVEVHGKLATTDHSQVVQTLQNRLDGFAASLTKRDTSSTIPERLQTSEQKAIDEESQLSLQALGKELDSMASAHPNLAFVLQQIKAWTAVSRQDYDDGNDALEPRPSLDSFSAEVSNVCNSVLVAMQVHKKAATELPTTSDGAAWLVDASAASAAMLKGLHMNGVTDAIRRCLSALARLDLDAPALRSAATSMLGAVLPILDQYAATCQQSVAQLRDLHDATGRMTHFLGLTFSQLTAKGFCTPQEKSDETQGDAGKLESGTGLGDGEGAEDISKDIQPDEDLSELAQEPNKERNSEMEDEKDAVDMADEDMEGDMGSVDGAEDEENGDDKNDGDDDGEDNDMEEEAGEVDDLDPTAVDEKMWDGENEDEAEKEQQGEKAKGQQKDEQTAAADAQPNDESGEMEEPGDEQGDEGEDDDPAAEQEDVQFQEDIKQDQNVQQEDALALPDDMELDLKDEESGSDDDDLDDMSDSGEPKDDLPDLPEKHESDVEDDQQPERGQDPEQADEMPEEEMDMGGNEIDDEPKAEEEQDGEDPDAEPEQPDEPEDKRQDADQDTANADTENAAPSDVKSGGQDQNADSMDVENEPDDSAAQRDEGDAGEGAAKQEADAGKKGAVSRSDDQAQPTEQQEDEAAREEPRQDPFKKLGDALERWHRQQTEIKEAEQKEEEGEAKQPQQDADDMAAKEFQHMQDDETAPDAQALGAASDDQVQPIDDAMAIDEEKEDPASRVMPESEQEPEQQDEAAGDQMDTDEPEDKKDGPERDDGRSGVKTRQGAFDREATPEDADAAQMDADEDEHEDNNVDEASAQLSETHLTGEPERPLRDFDEAMQLWTGFQTKTNALSLSLTSQLRLILNPSQSTKLSGSFRTGKRLNIKKIIPYIASSYKRDKIWMRRAVPTKRSYQILLCVDDSRSMGETAAGALALESLVMVSRALTMLEVGQVGVLGFGADVFGAHALDEPFASHDAGARVLQRFGFDQDRTDVAMLVRRTIDRFRDARARNPARGAEDLWQLALVLSDGLTPSSAHDAIRRLLREAMEERIMIVFIVMDDTSHKDGDSVLDLKEAKFVKDEMGNSKVVIERYLDTFPFQYYLIVHNLEELPNALAGLLRTWFAEVNA
ncbi:AAA ATPase midasin [Verticillium nonalfalfae]|uniref:Midasin n=1 Tax=Verticillium nonalfalfae TaxID=1051616 RepID=A0A3M9Y5A3_9PEZI|nr:AAA ATPase midasin [Verticillium nonalfalfae]RNJ55355.1 AAA ATPase midasin [Verticillium nonalfalfae]